MIAFKKQVRIAAVVLAGSLFSQHAYGKITELKSSVLRQPILSEVSQQYIYPPGIPAVLNKTGTDRTFVVEQYFSALVSQHDLQITVSGTWPRTAANALQSDGSDQYNDFIYVKGPHCQEVADEHGYRCEIELEVRPSAPSGTLGFSVAYFNGIEKVTHPNSVFLVIIPNNASPKTENFGSFIPDSVVEQPEPPEIDDDQLKSVVRIGMGGHFSLGSGFLMSSVEDFRRIFPSLNDSETSGMFVVTAAHLFPVGYGHTESSGYAMYDLYVDGTKIVDAATLIGRDVISDLALLRVNEESLPALANIFGVRDSTEIQGLRFSDRIVPENEYVVLGYPSSRSDNELAIRSGFLPYTGYPTDDTSNFGPIQKLKLEPVNSASLLAEPGMSGGPVLDQGGFVVGISTERPNDSNTLIALDVTNLTQFDQVLTTVSDDCRLLFNPFDRTLEIVNKSTSCNYGQFGSPRDFSSLNGHWTVQEVLGFSDPDDFGGHTPTNGHAIINGHVIINGHIIINGHVIIGDRRLEITSENFNYINDHVLADGYKLNADSFRSFAPQGVRILESPNMDDPDTTVGELIVKTKESRMDTSFAPVYSIREFAIWLHLHAGESGYRDLLCLQDHVCP